MAIHLVRHGLAVLPSILAMFFAASTADATPGALTPKGCINDAGGIGCLATQQGLQQANGVAVSPDGMSVYVAAQTDDAIVRFDRDASTGALTPAGCIQDATRTDCPATQQGLDGATAVAVSPDNKSVYVVSSVDHAIVRFNRDTGTGALIPAGCIQDVPLADCTSTQEGLNTPSDVTATNEAVYVTSSGDDAVVSFSRDTAGVLSGGTCFTDAATVGCTATEGLDGAAGVAASPDGTSLYVAAGVDHAMVRFSRATNGTITAPDCIKDVDQSLATCGSSAQGLRGANDVVVSADNKSVYTTSDEDFALARFDRNTSNGVLSPQGCVGDSNTVICGQAQKGMNAPDAVAATADNASVYMVAQNSNSLDRLDRDAAGAVTPRGCIGSAGDSAGCGVSQPGMDVARDVAVSSDGKSVYVVGFGSSAIAIFERGEDAGEPAVNPSGNPPGNPPVTPNLPDCTDPTKVLAACADPNAPPGFCASTVLPACGRANLPPTSCVNDRATGAQICRSSAPPLGACGSLGIALPECHTPTRDVPGLCNLAAANLAPLCRAINDITNICPPTVTPGSTPCRSPTTISASSLPSSTTPRASTAARRKPNFTVSFRCTSALAVRGRCKGRVAVDALRTALLKALTNTAQGTTNVYQYFAPGLAGFASTFQTAARLAASNALAGTKLPGKLEYPNLVVGLGRDDPLTTSYARALTRGVNEYRFLAGGPKPAAGTTSVPARSAAVTASYKTFNVKVGKRATVNLFLSKAAINRLVRDAAKRKRVPVRVLVVFAASPRPVVRLADLAVGVKS